MEFAIRKIHKNTDAKIAHLNQFVAAHHQHLRTSHVHGRSCSDIHTRIAVYAPIATTNRITKHKHKFVDRKGSNNILHVLYTFNKRMWIFTVVNKILEMGLKEHVSDMLAKPQSFV